MKNKYLIVVPRIVNKVGDWYQFPMGIAYISSYLSEYDLKKINLNAIEGEVSEILHTALKKSEIKCVLTGGLTGQYNAIKEIVKITKIFDNKIKTIVGGGIISSAPEYAMQALKYVDYGVIGEGEYITKDLLKYIDNNIESPPSIPGVIYKTDDKKYIKTAGKPKTVDIDSLPIPDYKGLNLDLLINSIPNTLGMCEYNTLPIITSRSCPYSCTFCFHPSGSKYRQRNLDNVFEEIDYLVDNFNVQFLSIQDELFGFDLSRVKNFCKRIKPYGIKWVANFRVTDITKELVDILKDSNCSVVMFGIESADNRILKSMKKRITIEDTERALKIVYDANLGIQGVLIFGDKEETIDSAKKTIQWWKQNLHYELQLSAIITYPGTELFRHALDNNIIKDPVQFIKDGCPVIKLSKHMNDHDYRWLFTELISLPRTLHTMPSDVKITNINYKMSHINVEGYCATCSAHNTWEKSRLFVMETLACKKCGRRHIAPIPTEVIERVKYNIINFSKEKGKLCFWGINSYFFSLWEKLNLHDDKSIYIVDNSELRQGLLINKHITSPPSIIEDENIKCVIVNVIQYYASLKNLISDNHHNVSEIYSISDLL